MVSAMVTKFVILRHTRYVCDGGHKRSKVAGLENGRVWVALSERLSS